MIDALTPVVEIDGRRRCRRRQLADEQAGVRAGDRIEHAALVPAELIGRLRELGPAVVTQPGFLADRGDDYLRDVPAAERSVTGATLP